MAGLPPGDHAQGLDRDHRHLEEEGRENPITEIGCEGRIQDKEGHPPGIKEVTNLEEQGGPALGSDLHPDEDGKNLLHNIAELEGQSLGEVDHQLVARRII